MSALPNTDMSENLDVMNGSEIQARGDWEEGKRENKISPQNL